jgi:hypothetical protein
MYTCLVEFADGFRMITTITSLKQTDLERPDTSAGMSGRKTRLAPLIARPAF